MGYHASHQSDDHRNRLFLKGIGGGYVPSLMAGILPRAIERFHAVTTSWRTGGQGVQLNRVGLRSPDFILVKLNASATATKYRK